MRDFNKAFGAYNAARTKERRFAIRIEIADGVFLWAVSHSDVTPGTGTTLEALTHSVSSVSQRLYPLDGRAEIGSLSFSAVDVSQDLSQELRTQLLTNSRGALGKVAQFYVGDSRLAFSQYELVTTQILQSCRVGRSGTEYQFRCRDVQREQRVDVFDPKETRLTANVSDTDTTISVVATDDFIGLDHGTSFSDAPSTDGVIYFRIDDEIIRTLEADATATQFVNCVRGVLGTRAAAHTTDENATTTPDKGKKVREIVYLEMPVPKLAYAVQTGVLIGQPGTMPAHWHADMPAAYIKLTDYDTIGPDLYDSSDDSAGVIFRFVDPGKVDAKRFVEQDLLRPLGLFQPVQADGQLGLRRLRRIVQGAAAVAVLDDRALLEAPTLQFAGEDIANEIEVRWNQVDDELVRSVVVRDANSIALWGERKREVIEARGLHGSRVSRDVVVSILQQAFDRRSGPPIRTSVSVHGSRSALEVGDIVRLVTSHARDWTGQTISLDRPFEIQGIRTDWQSNRITLDLEASSQAGQAIAPLADDEAIADVWFTAAGTDISGLPGVTDEGTHYEIGSDLTLTGNASLTATGAVFYADKDLTVAAGVTLTVEQNVQLRVLGVLTINGTIDGSGNGVAGVADTLVTSGITDFPTINGPVDVDIQAGAAGGFGSPQAAGGLLERVRQENVGSGFNGFIQSIEAPVTPGAYDVLPYFQLRFESSSVRGLPADLRGSGGGPGGIRYYEDTRPSPNQIQVNRGGTGGAGGAGLAMVTRGIAFGASGAIDTSGADGAVGGYSGSNAQPAHAGAGAGGAPGGVLMVIDGALNPAPGSIGGNVTAEYGASPLPSVDYNVMQTPLVDTSQKIFFGTTVPDDRLSWYTSASSGVDATFAATRVQFMPPSATPAAEQDDEELAKAEQITLAIIESYADVTDGAITRLTATITETSTTDAFSHAAIYMRRSGTDAWIRIGAAEPSFTFDLPADNGTLQFVAVPVLTNLLEAAFAARSNQVEVTVTNGAVGIIAGNVTGLVAGQNLLNSGASAIKSRTNASSGFGVIEWGTYTLASLGLEVGDVLSLGMDIRTTAGTLAGQPYLQALDGGGSGVADFFGGKNGGLYSWERRAVADVTIPPGTVSVRVRTNTDNSNTGTIEARRVMLVVGSAALPFEEPPLRVNRGEAEEGADVTGDHAADVDVLLTQNAPAEAGADVTGDHAADVDVLLTQNAPAEAGTTKGVIDAASANTDAQRTVGASWTTVQTLSITLTETTTIAVTVTAMLSAQSAVEGNYFCSTRVMRDTTELGNLSSSDFDIRGITAIHPFVYRRIETLPAGTYVYDFDVKRGGSTNALVRARVITIEELR